MIDPLPRFTSADIKYWLAGDTQQNAPTGYAGSRWFSSGADALANVCNEVSTGYQRKIVIYIPGYFCGQSLNPLRMVNADICFYSLTQDLQPNYEHIANLMRLQKPDVFVYVHYFGRIVGQSRIKDFANQNEILLIEDCAHIISPTLWPDWVGDYLIFSPHKIFPLPKLSIVFSRLKNSEPNKITTNFPYGWFARQIVRRVFPRRLSCDWSIVWSGDACVLETRSPHKIVIRAAMKYLNDYAEILRRRSENSISLKHKLSCISGWRPLFELSSDTTYIFTMICDTRDIARRRSKLFNRNTQLVAQWPDLPVEIRALPLSEKCIEVVERCLHFFIHHQLSQEVWLDEIDDAISRETSK